MTAVKDDTCSVDGCDRPEGRYGARGMCPKHSRRHRETLLALGVPVPRRQASPPRGPRARKPAKKEPVGPFCCVQGCDLPEGRYGGEKRCKFHLEELRDQCRRAGVALPISNASKALRVEPGYEIEDWPADQHAGLSIGGKCSAPWGCDNPIGSKGGRGLCPLHIKRWAQAFKDRGLPLPERASGRDPRCTLPSDDELVALIREHGSYTKTAHAAGVVHGTLQDFLERRPDLKARMDAEWRLVYRPKKYQTEEERLAAVRQQTKESNRRRALVPQQRLAFGSYGQNDADNAFQYANILDRDPCSYCGGPVAEIDHIVPLIKLGSPEWLNLTGACGPCNASKNDRDLLVFLLATLPAREDRMKQHGTYVLPFVPNIPSADEAEVLSLSGEQLSFELAIPRSADAEAPTRRRRRRAAA